MSTAAPSDAVARVTAVRDFLRRRQSAPHPRELVGRLAYQAYLVALLGGLYGTVVVRALASPGGGGATAPPATFVSVVPAVVVGIAAVATIVGLRLGTWAGPVLVSRAESVWLLPAPLDRRRLLRRDLGWGLAAYGAVGAIVGGLVGTIVALETGGGLGGALLGSLVGWTALGVLTGALSLAAESSARLARAALRLTVVLALVTAGIVWLSVLAPAAASWATPWGWATAPVVVAVGFDVPLGWLPVVLLVLAAVAAARWCLRRLPQIPDEELVRRAGALEGVRASAAVFDARAIAQARRSGQRWLVGQRHVRIRRPRHRWQLIPWRDLVSLLRRPGLLERTLVAIVAAVVLVWWAHGGAAALVGAVLLVSTAAAQLLEPLRIELEEPVIGEFAPLQPADLALEHLAAPFVVLLLCGILTAVVAAAASVLPWSTLPAALVGTVGAAALATTVAGLTSTRGAAPLQWLTTGEYGAVLLIGWMLAGPLLALVLGAPAALVVAAEVHAGTEPVAAVTPVAVGALVLSVVLALTTRWRARKRTASS